MSQMENMDWSEAIVIITSIVGGTVVILGMLWAMTRRVVSREHPTWPHLWVQETRSPIDPTTDTSAPHDGAET